MSVTLTSNAFVAGVVGLFRIGRAAQSAYREALRRKTITIPVPALEQLTREQCERNALTFLLENPQMRPLALPPDGPFHALFIDPNPPLSIDRSRPDLYRAAVDHVLETRGWLAPVDIPVENGTEPFSVPAAIVLQHRDWEGEQAGSLFAPLGRALAQTVLDITAAQPSLLGLNRKAETLLIGMMPALQNVLDEADWAGAKSITGQKLVRAFFDGAVQTLASHPDLVTDDEAWQPLVQGVLQPLQEQAALHEGFGFLARDRIDDFFAGPLARSVLSKIQEFPDVYLKGEMAEGRALGAVIRATITDALSVGPRDFDIRNLIGRHGAATLFSNLADVMQRQPELIVRTEGEVSDELRTFLQRAGGILGEEPSLLGQGDQLASELLAAALDAAGSVAAVRLRARLDGDDWDRTWGLLGSDIISGFVEGLKNVVVPAGGEAGAGLLDTLVTREQAVSLLKIVAGAIAENPRMVGKDVNGEVRNIAQGMAAAIAADDKALLTGEDWRSIFAVAMSLAARNPATLFSIREIGPLDEGDPEPQLAVALIRALLMRASEGFEDDAPQMGSLMFGATLREAVEATLQAASETVMVALSPARRAENIEALNGFVGTLNGLAAGTDAQVEVRLGAGDWIRVFRYFVVHILEHGPDKPVTAAHIETYLRGQTPDLSGAVQ